MWVFNSVSWEWKLWLLNASAVTYFVGLSFGSLTIGLLVTLPEVYKDDLETLKSRTVSACYVFLVLLLNYVCLKYYSRHSRVKAENCTLPRTAFGEETRFCGSCEVPIPPRAKHCPLCDVCVLKRDHHCFFGGCCVGFHNQRYFIVFCLYGSFGACYSMYATFSYLSIHYANVLSSQFYLFLLPWLIWYWSVGEITIDIVALAIFSYFSIMTFLACTYFFCFQVFLVWRGQTSYEYMKGIKRYCYPLSEHLKSIFGSLWFLNLVLPVPFIRSPDSGYDWKVVHDFKQM